MNLFGTYTLKWWQVGILKIALLATGVAVGAYWADIFLPSLSLIIIIAVIASAYSLYIWFKQQ